MPFLKRYKLRALLLVIILILSNIAAGCGSKAATSDKKSPEPEKQVLDDFAMYDLAICYESSTVSYGVDKVSVDVLLKNYPVVEAPSPSNKNQFYYLGQDLLIAYQKDAVGGIAVMSDKNSKVTTYRGIKFGSTADEVISKYGEPSLKQPGSYYYYFKKEGDKLTKLKLEEGAAFPKTDDIFYIHFWMSNSANVVERIIIRNSIVPMGL